MKLMAILTLLLQTFAAIAQDENGYPFRKFISSDSMLTLLNNYSVNTGEKINPYFLPRKNEVKKEVKEKFLSLLKRELSDSILKIKTEERFRNEFEYLHFYPILDSVNKRAKSILAEQFITTIKKVRNDTLTTISMKYRQIYDSVYKRIYDSAAVKFREEIRQQIMKRPVPDEVVLAAAALKLKEAVPIFEKNMLSGNGYFFSKETAEIALAGLGDTTLQKKYFSKHDEISKLKYVDGAVLWKDFLALALVIQSQESVSKLADWMDTSKTYLNNGGEGEFYNIYLTGAELVPNILWFIKNESLKEGYKKLRMKEGHDSYFDYYGITSEQMLFVRNWLLNNKGKYEFD